MKKNKFIIVIFNLCLIVVVIFSILTPLGKSENFYMSRYRKNNTAQITGYQEDELSIITEQIITYLFSGGDDLQVIIDDEIVFSNQALFHMEDVKELLTTLQQFAFIVFILFIVLGIYIYFKRHDFKKLLFKYSLITILIVFSILLVFAIMAAVDFNYTFELFHRIIFPDEIMFRDAFFGYFSNYPEPSGVDNTMLIKILSNQFFVDIALVIFTVTCVTLVIWLLITFVYEKKNNKIREELI